LVGKEISVGYGWKSFVKPELFTGRRQL